MSRSRKRRDHTRNTSVRARTYRLDRDRTREADAHRDLLNQARARSAMLTDDTGTFLLVRFEL